MFEYERKYQKKGSRFICGIDEVGRGPLAGPVMACAIIMPLENTEDIIDGVNDSKKLSEKKREILYELIIKKAIACSVASVDNLCIDKINILNATKLAMKNAVQSLQIKPDILLIDAVKLDIDTEQENIIKGDGLSYSIACASIVAKVTRDRLMMQFAKEYSCYSFEKNKGYGTKIHTDALQKYGACPIHRQSFIGSFLPKSI